MRCFVFIVCFIQYHVHASDWVNRTVCVDLTANRTASHGQYNFPERLSPKIITSGVDATNGQYPWSILTESRTSLGIGIPCSGTIISDRFFLSDYICVGPELAGEVVYIGIYAGSAQWVWPYEEPPNFVEQYWYIEATPENSPKIVLCQPAEPLIFNPNIQPIRLPYAANANFSYEAWSSLILGYRLGGIDQLQFVSSRIFNNDQCELSGSIADYEFCGTVNDRPNSGTWRHFGITGGAWMVYEYAPDLDLHPVVIGIYQYQFANGNGTFGLGTRISPFLDWIEALTGGLFK